MRANSRGGAKREFSAANRESNSPNRELSGTILGLASSMSLALTTKIEAARKLQLKIAVCVAITPGLRGPVGGCRRYPSRHGPNPASLAGCKFLEGFGRGDQLVPGEGFEPPTFGLQNRCTATVLTRRNQILTRFRAAFATNLATKRLQIPQHGTACTATARDAQHAERYRLAGRPPALASSA